MRALENASLALRSDYGVAIAVVSKCGRFLKYVEGCPKDSDWVVRTALLEDDGALEYAPDRFKKNRQFLISIIKNVKWLGPGFIKNIDRKLGDDRRFMQCLLDKDSSAAFLISDRLRKDRGFMRPYIERWPYEFGPYLDASLRKDRKFLAPLICINHLVLGFAADNSLREDPNFVRPFIEKNPLVLRFMGAGLRNHPSFMGPYIQKDLSLLEHVGETLKKRSKIHVAVFRKNSCGKPHVVC